LAGGREASVGFTTSDILPLLKAISFP